MSQFRWIFDYLILILHPKETPGKEIFVKLYYIRHNSFLGPVREITRADWLLNGSDALRCWSDTIRFFLRTGMFRREELRPVFNEI